MTIPDIYELFIKSPGVCTDTRNIVADSLFFALKGERFNGNEFAEQALRDGASYAIIDEKQHAAHENCILVDNALHCLQDLAAYHRHQLDIPIIGITGSNGKTTTKELMRDVLLKKYKVRATRGNLNNHIGVPLTLLELGREDELAIIEMGANHLGEIALLSSIANPDLGLITNIGRAHIGEFGGQDNIIKGKTELYDHLRMVEGSVFVHAQSEILMERSKDLECIIYGEHMESNAQCEILSNEDYLKLYLDGQVIQTRLIGAYNQSNFEAAISVGRYFQVADEDIVQALKDYNPDNNRSQLIVKGNKKVILDAYNANPSSMKAALENLAKMGAKKKFAILGHMLELGPDSHMEHVKLVEQCVHLEIPALFIGSEFLHLKNQGREGVYTNIEEARAKISSLELSEHLILIKGSRGIQLEDCLDLL